MITIKDYMRLIFGGTWKGSELVALYSARLDETGTGGESPHMAVGGAVATIDQWEKLEAYWDAYLKKMNVGHFHSKEFPHHSDYKGWSSFKQNRFWEKLGRICRKNTTFRISVGIDREAHVQVKEKMRGIKGFYPDSDYGLCLRYLMYFTCESIERELTTDFKLAVMVEDGPYASGAESLYGRVSQMTGRWKPAKHAYRLSGFGVVPKGKRRSLEAADYLVGIGHGRLGEDSLRKSERPQLATLLNRSRLEQWYEGMIKEKETRRDFHAKKAATEK